MNKYEERNLKGFEGDRYLGEEIQRLVKEHGIETIIETGTYLGGSTKKFCEMVDYVYTVESNDVHFQRASKYLDGVSNVSIRKGDSVEFLKHVLPKDNCLLFLDAHWYQHCPLLQELDVIAEKGMKPVIVIHDFKVPGKPELGFDKYNGQEFNLQWISDHLRKIYGEFDYHYNDKAEGAMRGVIFIYPKK